MQSGTVLAARYRLDRAIGAGGMGQVWAAWDELLGREVAIKVVEGGAREDLERFRQEARTAAALQHPNVVTIFDTGIDAGTAFLVMELLPGPDLETYLADRGVLPESEAVSLAEQVAAGLAAAHAAGVVHRDVKPANVVFQGSGTVKIVDFGIARLARTSAARLTAMNTLVGSASYLSPEQVEGRPGEEQSDIYALGCLLMTMMTGRPPFGGDHPLAIIRQHASGVAPRISEGTPGVSESLDQLVSEMLRKAPEERPASCQVVIDRLHGAGSAAGGRVARGGMARTKVLDLPTMPLAVGGGALPHRAEPVQTGRRLTSRAVMAAVGAVLLVVVATVAMLGRQGGEVQGASLATPSATTTVASPEASAASSSAQPTERSTPRLVAQEWTPSESDQQQESTQTSSEPDLTQAVSEVRSAVDAEALASGLDEDQTEELTGRIDRLGENGGKKADRQVQEMQQYVFELTAEGALSAEGSQRIIVALEGVRAAL